MVERVALGYEGFMRRIGFDVKDCIIERKFLGILPSMLTSARQPSRWTNEIKTDLVCKRFGLGEREPEPMAVLEYNFGVCHQRINQIIDSVISELRLPKNINQYKKRSL